MIATILESIPWWAFLLASFGLAALAGLFNGAEVALFRLERGGRLRRTPDTDLSNRPELRAFLDNSDATFASLQVGARILAIASALFLAAGARRFFPGGGFFATLGGLALAGVFLLFFGEAIPRAIAGRSPLAFLANTATTLRAILLLLWPLRWPLSRLAIRLVPPVAKTEPDSPVPGAEGTRSETEDEAIRDLLAMNELATLLREEERELIDSVFEFAETTAGEIMTPRADFEAWPLSTSQSDMVEILRRTPFSRVLIYEDNREHITGVLHVKEPLLDTTTPWQTFVRKPLFVAVTTELDVLLAEMKRSQSRLAVVVDEYGASAGIVTLHDLVEEIIGEIPEEGDEAARDIECIEAGVYIVAGRLEVAAVNKALNLGLPIETARTLGGVVFLSLGRVPRIGEETTVAGVTLRTLELDENRIERVELSLRRGAPSVAPAAAGPGSPAAPAGAASSAGGPSSQSMAAISVGAGASAR